MPLYAWKMIDEKYLATLITLMYGGLQNTGAISNHITYILIYIDINNLQNII